MKSIWEDVPIVLLSVCHQNPKVPPKEKGNSLLNSYGSSRVTQQHSPSSCSARNCFLYCGVSTLKPCSIFLRVTGFFTGLVYLVASRPPLEQVSTFGCVLLLKSKNIRKTANKETHENYLIYGSNRLKKRSAIPMHMYANLFSRYLSYVWKEGNLLSLYLVKHVLKPSLSLHRVICVASMSV